jgi:hypothetical protein
MANYFAQLPAYRNPEGIDFSPLNQAVQNFGETNRANAMAEYQAGRNRVADARSSRAEGRAQQALDEAKGKEALNQLAGIYQTIEQAPEAERSTMLQRAMPMYNRLRQRIPDFDQDFAGLGADPNDFMTVGKLIAGRVRGPVDPLKTQETQADIGLKQAQAKYYNERPRTVAGGSTASLIDRIMEANPGMSLVEATTIAKRGAGITEVGDELVDRNTGAPVRNVGQSIAAAERAKVTGKATGEAQAALASIRSKMPGLEEVVRQLDTLSESATYTTAGKTLDALRRETGAEPRESAVARKQYISLVDNQILPLLRDTFGAQFTQKEGESLKATLGDPDASPKEKQAVLKAFIEQKRRNIEAAAAEAAADSAAPPPPAGGNGWSMQRVD